MRSSARHATRVCIVLVVAALCCATTTTTSNSTSPCSHANDTNGNNSTPSPWCRVWEDNAARTKTYVINAACLDGRPGYDAMPNPPQPPSSAGGRSCSERAADVGSMAGGSWVQHTRLHVEGVVTEAWVLARNLTFLHALFAAVTEVATDLTLIAHPGAGFAFPRSEAIVRFPRVLTIAGSLHVSRSILAAFPQLRIVRRSVYLHDNPFLAHLGAGNDGRASAGSSADVGGLARLERIGGTLHVAHNPQIRSLSGLGRLREVGGGVALFGNTNLKSLAGLESLRNVGGALFIGGGQDGLRTCQGLDNLVRIGGGLTLFRTNLHHVYGLDKVALIGGNLTLQENNHLFRLGGLDTVKRIGGSLELYGQSSLHTMEGMNALQEIGADVIVQFHSELSFVGLDSLRKIGGNLIIMVSKFRTGTSRRYTRMPIINLAPKEKRKCENFEPVPKEKCALAAVYTLPPDAEYSNREQLRVVSWPTLEPGCWVDTQTWEPLYNNASAHASTALGTNSTDPHANHPESYDSYAPVCQVTGRVQCGADLSGLDNVRTIGGSIILFDAKNLRTLQGLGGVAAIGGALWVRACPHLESVAALSSLAVVGAQVPRSLIHVHPPQNGPDGFHGDSFYQQLRSSINLTHELHRTPPLQSLRMTASAHHSACPVCEASAANCGRHVVAARGW